MAEERDPHAIRVALIGKTGCGKSAFGNTLVGYNCFVLLPSGESVTTETNEGTGKLPSGKTIRVVDTPGILNTKQKAVITEVTKSIGFLSPGPHAFIIVLSPNIVTDEEKEAIKDLRNLFGNTNFLDHTMIVMVRKNEIRDVKGNRMDIHEFIDKMAVEEVQQLYERCGKRIVALENLASPHEQQTYAQEVADEISTMDGYFPMNTSYY
ncbi:GTPase IMAP family member 9-like [Mytilus californianus]|uniref:GTPase IMAP family member 9-like n=1 Tax=Mytilus californianus TaxID=6549 RepID=UPI002245DE63|nr:GTPase IMAP family member 9-like [Mytilus californianus]